MDSFPVNPIDILVAIILLLSAILAFSRGAVREVLGVGAWIGAALATVFGFRHLQPFARELIESPLIADAATAIAIFLVTLILLVVLSQVVAGRVQGSRLGALDRTIGFIFGLLRGAILICLAYMLFVWAMAEEDRPAWIAKAKTMPYIVRGTDAIRSVIPDEIEEKAASTVREQSESSSDAVGALRRYEELRQPPPPEPAPPPEAPPQPAPDER
ncbi:MAG: CvpA family protein [Alphaproteobacteria bacterium]